jgi:nucleosome binding factor SPN SPT16 subunit
MFGKKKHVDIQFYTELIHEQRSEFQSFCEKVEAKTLFRFDIPVPIKEIKYKIPGPPGAVLLQPTSGSLVNLTKWPPLVISLEDVEFVHFERVQMGNFDMIFVFKDYNKKVTMIELIPMNMLDHVKEWLK